MSGSGVSQRPKQPQGRLTPPAPQAMVAPKGFDWRAQQR